MTPVSVIIVSHGRPALLRRALIGVSQLFYRPFEVVVIADQVGLDHIADLSFAGRVKTGLQTEPNISQARNQGADMAAGAILAFIDDDAVPEPTWLTHLVAPFDDPSISATTGTVLGRNGISVQWGQRCVDATGVSQPILGVVPDGCAVKLEGTNMAIRRDALVALGGFDPAFSFFLDETDIAYRLMKSGKPAVCVPNAQVHHGYAESLRRSANRAPLSLFQIGASSAVYLRKHANKTAMALRLTTLLQEQSDRVQGFVRSGKTSVDDMRRLLEELQDGVAFGRDCPIGSTRSFPTPPKFSPLLDEPAPKPLVLSGRWFNKTDLLGQAEQATGTGHSTSLILLAPTVRSHRVEFTQGGVWLQTGGLFGPSTRSQPRFRYWGFSARVAAEHARLAGIRWI